VPDDIPPHPYASPVAWAASWLTAQDAADHIGEVATVCGTVASRLTGGRKSDQFVFDEQVLPVFRFEIGPFQREDQQMQFYTGTVFLRDGTTLPARFTHDRWPTSKQIDVDYERFDIQLLPKTFKNQPFLLSIGGYFDRDKKQFVLRELGLVINNQIGMRNESVVFGIVPEASAVPMPK
jgi:hypothetical protein